MRATTCFLFILPVILVFGFKSTVSDAATYKVKDSRNNGFSITGALNVAAGEGDSCKDVCSGNLCKNESSCAAGSANPSHSTACSSQNYACTCNSSYLDKGYRFTDSFCEKECSGDKEYQGCCISSGTMGADCKQTVCNSCGTDFSWKENFYCVQGKGYSVETARTETNYNERYYALTENDASGAHCLSTPEPVTCEDWLAINEPDVSIASDNDTLANGLAYGKSTVVVTQNIDVTAALSIGSKKLVGAKNYETASGGKCGGVPKLNDTASVSTNAVTIAEGMIENLNIVYNGPADGIVRGSGTIKDASIEFTNATKNNTTHNTGILVTSNMIFQGTVTLTYGGLVTENGAIATIEGDLYVKDGRPEDAVWNKGIILTKATSSVSITNSNEYGLTNSGTALFEGVLKIDDIKEWSSGGKLILKHSGNSIRAMSPWGGISISNIEVYGSLSVETPNSIQLSGTFSAPLTLTSKIIAFSGSIITVTPTLNATESVAFKNYTSVYASITSPVKVLLGPATSNCLLYHYADTVFTAPSLVGSAASPICTLPNAKMKIGGTCKAASSGANIYTLAAGATLTSPPSNFDLAATCP